MLLVASYVRLYYILYNKKVRTLHQVPDHVFLPKICYKKFRIYRIGQGISAGQKAIPSQETG